MDPIATTELEVEPRPDPRRRGAAPLGLWAGLVLVALGFVVVFVSWGRVAGLSNVAQQLPYVLSGGFAGLSLVIVGALVIDVATRRQDEQVRGQDMNLIRASLHQLAATMDEVTRQDPSHVE